MAQYRAARIWHVAESRSYFFAEDQFFGFTRYATREDAEAAIERALAEHPGDRWREESDRQASYFTR